jgi:hypothetical protein
MGRGDRKKTKNKKIINTALIVLVGRRSREIDRAEEMLGERPAVV